MAEKYGVVPKKFTRAWWEYFWMYYKWHTIAGGLAAIMTAVTVVQCATREKFDLTVNYVGFESFSQECLDKAEEIFNEYASDADGNGEVNVFLQQMNISRMQGSEQMDYALQTKHDLELSNDGSFIFMYDEQEAEKQLNRGSASDAYLDVRKWADTEIPEDRLIKAQDGTPIAVKLESGSVLSKSGINTEGMVICVRQNYDDNEFNSLSHQGAVSLANALIK